MLDAREAAAIVEVERQQSRYVQAVDAGEGDAAAALFTPDGVFEGAVESPLEGRDAIRDFFTRRELVSPPRRHHVTSMDAQLDPDGVVRATTYLQVVGLGGLTAGYYHDEFEHVDGEWLFRRKHLYVEIFTG